MASNSFIIQIEGVEGAIKGLVQIEGRAQSGTRLVFEEWGQDMVALAQQLSPRDKLRGIDPRRRPEKESFALKWRYEVKQSATGVELRVGNIDPKMPLIVFPTPPRDIPKGGAAAQHDKGYPMRFFWSAGGGWANAFQIRGGVAAHGTPGQPVHQWVVEQFDFGRHTATLANFIVGG